MGTWKDSPSLPRPPPPPQLGSRHVVPGVGGEERLDFLDAPFASSSFSLSRQLRGRSAPPERAGERSSDRSPEPRAGDAGAAGGTCGSSRRRRSPRRQQRGPPKLRQPPPLRRGQDPPRSPPRRHLPAPGPAAPGGCGSSASQPRFADCSCFQVRGEAGSPGRGAHRDHRRPRAAQRLPRWSSAAAGAQRHREGKSPGPAPLEERGGGFAGLELPTLGARTALSEEAAGSREGPSCAGASARERHGSPRPRQVVRRL